ncbi:uncharacterized protein LOC123397786 [Hordeum vulgare subsp. vulgare]|uniref:uncharacterized protein LOC123397786 n=1 Tax=Hordeum vulgare subsp. vulgare TaxID=112509 RepID=UPI001D1A4A6D|nr:uncharacterized protein LOC123397786 [Hordeum vulgare subsp. vulgare]
MRSGEMRLALDTFDTVDEATHVYVATAWRPRWPRREMNFSEVMTLEWAHRLAPPPRVVTEEDRRQNRRRERRLDIAEMDEQAIATWCQQFPQDVLDEREFFAQRRMKRRAMKRRA